MTAGNWRGPVPVGCRREAARRAPKVLRRSGRTHVADSCVRIAPARQSTLPVIRFPCQVVLSRGKVAPSARGALCAPLKTLEKVLTGTGCDTGLRPVSGSA